MNIHPIFVHFPIAFLTMYSIMEILQFKKLRDSHTWNNIKAFLVIIGTGLSFLALQTGELAEGIIGRSRLVETHSTFATISTWFFIIMAIVYFIHIINNEFTQLKDWCWNTKYIRTIWRVLSKITDIIFFYWGMFIALGIMGLVLITITGALGGAIVYGPTADPVVSFIYNLFL